MGDDTQKSQPEVDLEQLVNECPYYSIKDEVMLFYTRLALRSESVTRAEAAIETIKRFFQSDYK